MLKYLDSAVVFQEFPDEITLAVDITNCPCRCKGCSEPYLQDDIGNELTYDAIDSLIEKNKGITLFGLMGGDSSHIDCIDIAVYIHSKYPKIKVGMYSGLDYIDLELAYYLDYYKIGRYIQVDDTDEYGGPINCQNSNQVMFKKVGGNLVNITKKFRENTVNKVSNYTVK